MSLPLHATPKAALLGIIAILGIFVWRAIIRRFMHFRAADRDTTVVTALIINGLLKGDYPAVLTACDRFPRSHLSKLLAAGLTNMKGKTTFTPSLMRYVDRNMELVTDIIGLEFSAGNDRLETAGIVSPLLGVAYSSEVAAVAGVLITAPALFFSRHFKQKVERYKIEMVAAWKKMLSYMEKSIERDAPST
jgi:biopolymer transport protein ExbB/TolQ